MYFLLTEEDEFRLDLRKLKLNPDYMISVMKIGFPAGLQGVVFSLSNVVIQTAVNSFGSDCIPFFRTPADASSGVSHHMDPDRNRHEHRVFPGEKDGIR